MTMILIAVAVWAFLSILLGVLVGRMCSTAAALEDGRVEHSFTSEKLAR